MNSGLSEEIIELEDIKRIRYEDIDPGEPPHILDWEGKKGSSRWNKYDRNESGTRWYGPCSIDVVAEKHIRSKLEPAAEKLGINLGKFGQLEKINIRTLVENVATKIETRKEKAGLKGDYSREEINVDVYQTSDGIIIQLKQSKYIS